MRERATKKQQALLQYITDFLSENNYAPSYREIMAQLGYKSVSTVAVHVDALITKGYLTKHDKSARSIRVAGEKSETEITHLAWLGSEITRLETAGADQDRIATLQKAHDILSSN
jgi:SOS-response transcriptional repressor LexA